MKAISLTQPWASLVAIGAKSLETRSWSTSYRGPLAIHASKAFPAWARELCGVEPFSTALLAGGVPKWPNGRGGFWRSWDAADDTTLPLGAIVAVCNLAACIPTTSAALISRLGEQERAFGNFEPGRYAWRFENVRRLPEPIPCRGSLGLWDVPPDVAARLEVATGRQA